VVTTKEVKAKEVEFNILIGEYKDAEKVGYN
jgi:hypothetical protein